LIHIKEGDSLFTYINQLGLKGKITLISSGALLLGAISITMGQLEYFQKKKSVEITNELIEQSKAFAEFEFGLAKVNLAAMDALIDEASGKVAPELVEEVESVTSSFKSNRALLTKAAKSVGKEADIESAFKMTEELLSASVLAFNL
jgi:hypothetical protein